MLEVIEAACPITSYIIGFEQVARRPGDPVVLVASRETARRVLDWRQQFTDIGEMIETAWRWHRAPHYLVRSLRLA